MKNIRIESNIHVSKHAHARSFRTKSAQGGMTEITAFGPVSHSQSEQREFTSSNVFACHREDTRVTVKEGASEGVYRTVQLNSEEHQDSVTIFLSEAQVESLREQLKV